MNGGRGHIKHSGPSAKPSDPTMPPLANDMLLMSLKQAHPACLPSGDDFTTCRNRTVLSSSMSSVQMNFAGWQGDPSCFSLDRVRQQKKYGVDVL